MMHAVIVAMHIYTVCCYTTCMYYFFDLHMFEKVGWTIEMDQYTGILIHSLVQGGVNENQYLTWHFLHQKGVSFQT